MKLSIVTTLFQSATYIHDFYQRVVAVAELVVGDDYEIIFVNDGSPDNSLEITLKLVEEDSHVVVVDLSRNFGQHNALMSGLKEAIGEKVFLIDSDLEEQPEWLLPFYTKLEEEKCDVIYGVQKKRKGSLFERWSGEIYYTFLFFLTGVKLSRNIVIARLMSRGYVDALLLHKERDIIFSYLCMIVGFSQQEQPVEKLSLSPTTYSLASRFRLATHSITSFSPRPLELFFYFGLFVTVLSICAGIYLVVHKFFLETTLSGWTSLMVSLWFLGGVIISILGAISLYISKIYIEVKQRPQSIVKQIYANRKSNLK
jgi:putative glycosyltransferase